MRRTFAIGDIHGEAAQLGRVLAKLPPLDAEDTVVFLGDYLDRGADSRGVIARVEELRASFAGRCVTLRGNHEDAWLGCLREPNVGFLLTEANGCYATLASYQDVGGMPPNQQAALLLQPQRWFPDELADWIRRLPLWYEDAHAIFVHAGLEGEGTTWLHPSLGRPHHLMWTREGDFWTGYHGKRLVFGHTVTTDLPRDARVASNAGSAVWVRSDLIGIDTGSGKGGYLSAIELPSGRIYDSR